MGISNNSSGANIGDIKPNASAAIPAGWLACGGQAVSRTTYAALFLALGTLYGVGDGATTFNLPDCRGRALFGKDDLGGTAANRLTVGVSGVAGVTLGAVGGGEGVTLASSEMPSHTHQNNYAYNSAAGAGAGIVNSNGALGSYTPTSPTPQAAGGGAAHKNIPPALVTNYIIKV